MDLLLRLREMGKTESVPPSFFPINRDGHEAAAEIEKLRAALHVQNAANCADISDGVHSMGTLPTALAHSISAKSCE